MMFRERWLIMIRDLLEWEDAVQDVADTLGLQVDALGLAPMPRAEYITLPVASSSTSKVDFVPASSSSLGGDSVIPPPPPPLEGEDTAAPEATTEEPEAEVEQTTTGNKRKTRGSAAAASKAKGKGKKGSKAAASAPGEDEQEEGAPASKAARTNEGNQSASGAGKILTVLKEEHYKMPELPSVQDLESFLVARQKEELLKEYV